MQKEMKQDTSSEETVAGAPSTSLGLKFEGIFLLVAVS